MNENNYELKMMCDTELLDEYTRTVMYNHYDPFCQFSETYDEDSLYSEILRRMQYDEMHDET